MKSLGFNHLQQLADSSAAIANSMSRLAIR